MAQMNLRKTESSSSRPMIAAPIRMQSVERGLRYSFDEMVEQKIPDNKARKSITRASKVMNDIAATIASQLSNAEEYEMEPELDVQDITEHLIRDEELWKEFRKHLVDAEMVTNLGVNEVLRTFVAENRNRIESRYKDAAVMEDSEKTQSLMEKALSLTGMTAVVPPERSRVQRRASDSRVVASSVKRAIHRTSSISFQITPSLSDQCQDPSDKLRGTSEAPTRHSISFDSNYWGAKRYHRMSLDLDSYRRSLSRSTNILQDSSDPWTESIGEKSSSGNAEKNPKSSSSMRNSGCSENTPRIGLFKKLASSINVSTKKDYNAEEEDVGTKKNMIQTLRINRIWKRGQTKKKCNLTVGAKKSSSEDVPMSAKSSMNTAVSSPIMSVETTDTPSFKKRDQHKANDSVRIQLKVVSSSHLDTRHSFSCTKDISVTTKDEDVPILDIGSKTDGAQFVTNKNNGNRQSFGSTIASLKQESTADTSMKEQERLNLQDSKEASTIFVEKSKETRASFTMQLELKSSEAPTEFQNVYF